ncbi:DUF4344 domain-containing metallopeptidase [Streptomyces sp. NPDC088745]|uniref:DUF4344 domain-containing metallopeptidase n=1 Tax=Streptomyces sp. NPDC088745 TaxID=3365884 RepID=UPI0038065C2E
MTLGDSGARRRGGRARNRARRAVLVLGAALLAATACAGPGGAEPGPDRPVVGEPAERPVLAVRYEAPAAADRPGVRFLHERRVVRAAEAALGSLLDWRGREPIALLTRSCAGDGSSYDPEKRRIELCYDEIAETRTALREGGQRATDDEVAAVLLETLYHEVAHALVDRAGVRVAGNEEDAADRFAALMLLREGEAGVRRVLYAADGWAVLAELYEDDPEGAGEGTATAGGGHGGHSSDRDRAVSLRCYAYGAVPASRRHLLGLTGPRALPAARAAGCADEWKGVREGWMRALGPVLRTEPPVAGPGDGRALGG